jgi:hypothetical protein
MLRLRLALFGIAVVAIAAPHLWRQLKEAFFDDPATPRLSRAKPILEVPAGEENSQPVFDVIVPGRIVDPHEQAVQDAVVEVSQAERDGPTRSCTGSGQAIVAHTSSDAEGVFTFTLKENQLYCMRGRHGRWGESEPAFVDTGEETEESIQLRFR